MSLQSLQTAFANAAWPVNLNAAFLTSAGVSAPVDFDTLLGSAFCLGKASGLSIGQGAVGTITGNSFSIVGASLTNGLFGASSANTIVTLSFTLPPASSTLLIQITTSLGTGWRFATGFPEMVGKPFSMLTIAQPCMLFSSAASTLDWPVSGSPVALAPAMNFAGTVQLNDYAQSILAFTSPVPTLQSPLVISGPFNASAVAASGSYPVMDLGVALPLSNFSLLGFNVVAPRFALTIGPVPSRGGQDDNEAVAQDISYDFAATLSTATTPSLPLDFAVMIYADKPASARSYTLLLTPSSSAQTVGVPLQVHTGEVYTMRIEQTQTSSIASSGGRRNPSSTSSR